MNKNIHEQDDKISWKAYSGNYVEKDANWYWFFWTIIIFIIFLINYFNIGAVSENNITGMVVLETLIIIAGLTITLASVVKPKSCIYEIYSEGIVIQNKFISFESLESYKIDLKSKSIFLKRKEKINMLEVIPLSPIVNLKKIYNILNSRLTMDNTLKRPEIEIISEKILGL